MYSSILSCPLLLSCREIRLHYLQELEWLHAFAQHVNNHAGQEAVQQRIDALSYGTLLFFLISCLSIYFSVLPVPFHPPFGSPAFGSLAPPSFFFFSVNVVLRAFLFSFFFSSPYSFSFSFSSPCHIVLFLCF